MTHEYTPPSNRSEIAFIFDAKDCNPNGDPLSSDNRPRIDPATDQLLVTDVRLKRYIRDQLYADGEGILIKSDRQLESGTKPTRENLYRDIVDELDDGADEITAFLEAATDVRYFGATISVDYDDIEGLPDDFPDQFIGPVQFRTGRSYHPVELNDTAKRLTTVIYSDEDAEQGTFATDNRIKYAVIGFSGVVNENAAPQTRLSSSDVERLDSLVWRALKNQTLTRSKVGQQPRLYARVEYERDDFHIGGLEELFDVQPEHQVDEMRSPEDFTLDASRFREALESHADAIASVVMRTDDRVQVTDGQDTYPLSDLPDRLGQDLGIEITTSR